MPDSLQVMEKVRAVAQMGRPEPVAQWQAQFGAPPPPKLRMELMRPVLVYRIQENAYGLSVPRGKSHVQDLASEANRRRFKTGTKIIREWKGQLYEVAVTAEGYVQRRYPQESVANSLPDHGNEMVGSSLLRH